MDYLIKGGPRGGETIEWKEEHNPSVGDRIRLRPLVDYSVRVTKEATYFPLNEEFAKLQKEICTFNEFIVSEGKVLIPVDV